VRREKLLGVVGALVLRQIGLSKAAEIMGMGKEGFLELSYLFINILNFFLFFCHIDTIGLDNIYGDG
jgi:hypothetical protein